MAVVRIVVAFVAAVGLAGYFARVEVRELIPAAASRQEPAVRVDSVVEKALRERVTSYWEARSHSKLLAAYEFYEPSFRAKYSADQFVSTFQRLLRFKPALVNIERVRFEPGGQTAVVSARLRSHPAQLDGEELVSVTEETWNLIDSVWYRQAEALLPAF